MEEKNLPDKIDERITEWFNKDPIILAGASILPYFGGVLATFYAGKGIQLFKERTDELFRQFSDHLNTLDEQAVRKDYFDTPEGIDLFIKAIEQSSKTRSAEKRDLIARTLTAAVDTNKPESDYSPEDYLNLISDLTVRELLVARSLYDERPENNEESWTAWETKACQKLGIPKPDLRLAVGRLGSTGLLHQVSFGEGRGGTWGHVVNYGETGYYEVTAAFDKLMKFLSLDA